MGGSQPENSRSLNAPTIHWLNSIATQHVDRVSAREGDAGSAVLHWDEKRYRVTVERIADDTE